MRAGHLRHGGAHRKQAAHLRVKLASAAVWCIRIEDVAVRFSRGAELRIPPDAEVEYFREPARAGTAMIVRTKPGTALTYHTPLPRGVTIERRA